MRSMSKTFVGRWLPIAGVVIAVAFYFGNQKFDTWRTAQKFKKLELQMSDLESKLEKLDQGGIAKNTYCLRDGEKFGGGQMRCTVLLSATFQDADRLKTEGVDEIIKSNGFTRTDSIEAYPKISNASYLYEDFSCRLTLTKESAENTQFEFYCIDAVNKPVYPVME